MNPLIKGVCKNTNFLSKVFGQKVSHLNPHAMAMYVAKYGIYCGEKDKALEEKFQIHNEKYLTDLKEIQDYQKVFAEKTWKVEKSENGSYLHRVFKFNTNNEAVKFLEATRSKCNELDHHPELSVNNNIVEVKLTSHFNQNNVSEKDYELACLFSVQYDDCCAHINNQTYLSYLIGASLILGSAFVSSYIYHFKRNYNYTSMDFMFAKIDTANNAYVKKAFQKY